MEKRNSNPRVRSQDNQQLVEIQNGDWVLCTRFGIEWAGRVEEVNHIDQRVFVEVPDSKWWIFNRHTPVRGDTLRIGYTFKQAPDVLTIIPKSIAVIINS